MNTYGRNSQSWSKHKKKKRSRGKKKPSFSLDYFLSLFSQGDFWKNIILGALVLFFLGTFSLFLLFAWYSRDLPDPGSLIDRDVPLSTKIYDRSGEDLLYEISSGEKRTLVTLDQIPDYLEQATITAEDRKFYQHNGIDVKGLARALFTNVITLDPTGQGASTITQQLVKNAILSNEKTIARKVKEIMLSVAMERRYSKDEILQLYLNEIPYGSTNYGAESAARSYFGKSVSDLTLAESATIAALPQIPTVYLNNPDRLQKRKNWILESMAELEYISEEEKNEAIATDTPVRVRSANITAPHFVLWVREQLVSMFDERTVEEGGLQVITTLDLDKQTAAEESLSSHVEGQGEAFGFNNAGLVSIDPKDGSIVAMVGSADYFNDDIDGQVNVTLRPLQPGSSFKPIIYAAAFERGYTPNTLLWDVVTTFPSTEGAYVPKNFDFDERGPISIRAALQGSLNIPAVKALYLVGVEQGLQFAERLGYSTFADRSRFGLAIVLGGGEVLPLEHAAAYATFASEGIYREPFAIQEVLGPDGKSLFAHNVQESEKRVLDVNIARMVSNVLSDDAARAYIFGTGSNLTLPGRQVAAKTGTTNDTKDGWTAGYTPDLVSVVWAGNTDGSSMNANSGGSRAAAPIWNAYMREALKNTPASGFTSPDIPKIGKAMLDGELPRETFVIDRASGLLATEFTPPRFREEKVCGQYHNILTYVDTSDPTGTPPADPGSANSAWVPWETAVLDFMERFNADLPEGAVPFENCEKPAEEDNIHTRRNQPRVDILSPRRGESFENSVSVSLDINIPRGSFSRIEYLIDELIIDIGYSQSGQTVTLPAWVQNGNHTFIVRAYDDVDNVGTDSVPVRIDRSSAGPTVILGNVFVNQEFPADSGAHAIAVETQGVITSAGLQTLLIDGSIIRTQDISSPSPVNSVSWEIPGIGTYLLRAYADGPTGRIYSGYIPVHVRTPISVAETSVEEVDSQNPEE